MQKVSETSLAMKLNTSDVCNTLYRKASSNLREFHWICFVFCIIMVWNSKIKLKLQEKRVILIFLVRQYINTWCPCLFQGQGHHLFLRLPFTVSIQSIACKRVFAWHVVRLSVALAVFCVCVPVENMWVCVSDRRRDQGGVYHSFCDLQFSPPPHRPASCSSTAVICVFGVRQRPRGWCCCWSGHRSWGLPRAPASLCAAACRSTEDNWAGRIPAWSGPVNPRLPTQTDKSLSSNKQKLHLLNNNLKCGVCVWRREIKQVLLCRPGTYM